MSERQPGDAELPVLDESRFTRLFKGNNALLMRVSVTFFTSSGETMQNLASALSEGDRVQAGRHAHSLKGALANLGAARAAAAAHRLEALLNDAVMFGYGKRKATEGPDVREAFAGAWEELQIQYTAFCEVLRTLQPEDTD